MASSLKQILENGDNRVLYRKAADYCALQDRCISEVRSRLLYWGAGAELTAQFIQALIEEGFIDEQRFAIAFARGKFRNLQWGKVKIRFELKNKGITQAMIEKALSETEFLNLVKKAFHLKVLKHTPLLNKSIKKVAFCGGSGAFLIKNAINSGSDAYISADIKYHEFFDAESKILIADTGHFENEQFTPEIFYELIQKKFTTFAPYLSKVITNPVNYF